MYQILWDGGDDDDDKGINIIIIFITLVISLKVISMNLKGSEWNSQDADYNRHLKKWTKCCDYNNQDKKNISEKKKKKKTYLKIQTKTSMMITIIKNMKLVMIE